MKRQTPARLMDPRLAGGVALLVVSAIAGALLLTRSADTVTVWRAARDLSVGVVPVDLEPIAIDRSLAADRYVGPQDPIDGPLRWPVAAGELLPRAALGPASTATRRVTVPVDPLHAPVGLLPGDLVDVWATTSPMAAAADAAPPGLVLAAAAVVAMSDEGLGMGGEIAVVLDVPAEAVSAIVRAARSGPLDLVAVPVSSQVPVA